MSSCCQKNQNWMANMVTQSVRQVPMLHWESKAETTFAKHACHQDQRQHWVYISFCFSPQHQLAFGRTDLEAMYRQKMDNLGIHCAHWTSANDVSHVSWNILHLSRCKITPWDCWCRDSCRGNWHPTSRSPIGRPKCQHPKALFSFMIQSGVYMVSPSHTNHPIPATSFQLRVLHEKFSSLPPQCLRAIWY